MIFYVIYAALGWIAIKGLLFTWRYARTCRLVAPIPKLSPNHWFWGFLYKVQTPNDLLFKIRDYVQERKPRWFSAWNMVFYPVVFPADPGTMREVLTATNVPKHDGLEGSYRMIKGWLGEGLLVSNGKKWERSRRLLTPAFHFDILKGYVEDFNAVANNLVSKLQELTKGGDSVAIFPLVSRATLDSMLRCTVSYKDDTVQSTHQDHPYVAAVHRLSVLLAKRWMNPLLYPDWIYDLTENGRQWKTLCEYVHTFSDDIIHSRRNELESSSDAAGKRHPDFLDILLTAKDGDGNGLTDREIRDEVDTFVFEGHDTTASGISWMLYALAKYPDMQHMVRQEVDAILDGRASLTSEDLSKLHYTTRFIKESLRVYSPVPYTERRLCEPLKMNGVTLKPGQKIDLVYYAVHHHPDVWENPEEFQPDRFLPDNMKDKDPFSFLPFSAGQRNCIGQHFAMNEIKIIISTTVSRCELALNDKRPAEIEMNIIMRSKDGIHLYITDRHR